jgi:hypothetical protein
MSKTGIFLIVVIVVVLVVVVLASVLVKSQAGASEWRYWTAPGDPLFPGDPFPDSVVAYDLRFAKAPFDTTQAITWESFSGVPVPASPGQPDSCQVTALEFSTVYGFLIRSRDRAGNWSGWSNLVTDTTADRRGPLSIVDFR